MFAIYDLYGEFLLRILLASLLGGLIGLERDIHGRAAGLRTHLLVSLGAAIFTLLSEVIANNAAASGFTTDPARIAAQIVSGIGFLGAGVIIKEGANVRGLTTAACLWTVAAIGMAVGSGYYTIAIFATAIAIIGLVILKYGENLYAKDTYRILSIQAPIEVSAPQIIQIIKSKRLKILNCDIDMNYKTGTSLTRLSIKLHYHGKTDKLAHDIIKSLESSSLKLKEIRWEHM
jgi:putative Mg2+ transporter-C (MgtC) family protein